MRLFRGHTNFTFYVNDGIFSGPCKEEIGWYIKDVMNTWLDIKDKWYI